MDSKRNRITELKEYLSSLGIEINICKTKARGNRGVFLEKNGKYRIDISKNISETSILPILVHEFAHYIHFKHDPSLKSLEFLFENLDDQLKEELIKITVIDVPKDFASSLYDTKKQLTKDIKELSKNIKEIYPDFKSTEPFKKLERNYNRSQKFLLKYDAVKIDNRVFTIKSLKNDFDNISDIDEKYFNLKSKQRYISRINSKINRLNRYYNSPSELFARFVEYYFTKSDLARKNAPLACKKLDTCINSNKIKYFAELSKIFN